MLGVQSANCITSRNVRVNIPRLPLTAAAQQPTEMRRVPRVRFPCATFCFPSRIPAADGTPANEPWKCCRQGETDLNGMMPRRRLEMGSEWRSRDQKGILPTRGPGIREEYYRKEGQESKRNAADRRAT